MAVIHLEKVLHLTVGIRAPSQRSYQDLLFHLYPNQVTYTNKVYTNIKNKIEEEVAFVGEKELKNIEEPVKIYQINIL